MKFTYAAYRNLISLLRDHGYSIVNYHSYRVPQRCVILRHDVDNSLAQAAHMAEIEHELGVSATYFVLLRTDFYNVASAGSQRLLRRIMDLGHEIGLHFDEAAFPDSGPEVCAGHIKKECAVLSQLLDEPVTVVSMHRPSKATLEADLHIPGVVNSYGSTFFHDFKYLSDSRRHWREPVEDIIRSEKYDRLHILTHAFWYHDGDQSIDEAVGTFIRSANRERYFQMNDNFRDLGSVLAESNI